MTNPTRSPLKAERIPGRLQRCGQLGLAVVGVVGVAGCGGCGDDQTYRQAEVAERGDDPAAIHGHDMDGVTELRAGYTDITVTYTDLPDGAQLGYTTDRSNLVEAIHAWFDRQIMDHGVDAQGSWPRSCTRSRRSNASGPDARPRAATLPV